MSKAFFEEMEAEVGKRLKLVSPIGEEYTLANKLFLFGLSGAGKTTLCVDILRQCLDKKMKCLYVDVENKLHSNSYFQNLFKERKADMKENLIVMTGIKENNRTDLLKEVKSTDAKVVIIDSFTNLFLKYLENKKRSEIRTFMNELVEAVNGRMLVTVHHAYNLWGHTNTSKLWMFGGNSLMYSADEVLLVRAMKDHSRVVELKRNAHEFQLPNFSEVKR